MRCVATSEACETGASFRERSQVVSLLTAVRNAIPGDEPAKRMPTAAAVLAAEAAAASLHPACETYVPLQRAVLRRAALDTDALPISFLSMLNGGGGGGGGAGGDEGGMMSTRGEARALRVWVLRLLLASLRSGPDDARLFRKAFTVEVLMSHRSAALSADPYARQLALAVVGRAARTPIAARALVEGSGLIPWLAAAASSACHPTRAHVGEGYGARAAAAAAAVTALADLAEQRGAIHGGPSGTAADFLSALRDVRAALALLCHDKHGGGGGGSGELAVCRAMLAPTLRLHVAIARQLSRRRGEVIDVAEVAALCGAVDAAARAEPGVRTGSATNTRGGSRTSGSGSGSGPGASRIVGNSSGVLRAAMLEVVVGSAGAGRNSMFPIGSVTGEHTALAAARALAAVVPWAAAAAAAMTATVGVTRGGADVEAAAGADDAVGKGADTAGGGSSSVGADKEAAEDAAARVLRWATSSMMAGGIPLAVALAARGGGGGAARAAALLGALHAAAGPRHRAAATPALVRAQARLLRALLPTTRTPVSGGDRSGGQQLQSQAQVADGDRATCAALRQPVYAALFVDGGALDELLNEVGAAEAAAAAVAAEVEAAAEAAAVAAAAAAEAVAAAEAEAAGESLEDDGARDGGVKKRKRKGAASSGGDSALIINQRGALAASLAATLLRGAFAAASPIAFVRHVTDECGSGARVAGGGRGGGRHSRHRFRFERAWEDMRLGDSGEGDNEGVPRCWQLAAVLSDAWGVVGTAGAGRVGSGVAMKDVGGAGRESGTGGEGHGRQSTLSPEPPTGGIHVKKRARVIL